MVYSGVVPRTQVYLTEHELELLAAAEAASGASRSELIRRAIRAKYGSPERSKEERRANLRAAAGIWKDRPFNTEEYIRAIRGEGGMNERLRRIGVE